MGRLRPRQAYSAKVRFSVRMAATVVVGGVGRFTFLGQGEGVKTCCRSSAPASQEGGRMCVADGRKRDSKRTLSQESLEIISGLVLSLGLWI